MLKQPVTISPVFHNCYTSLPGCTFPVTPGLAALFVPLLSIKLFTNHLFRRISNLEAAINSQLNSTITLDNH